MAAFLPCFVAYIMTACLIGVFFSLSGFGACSGYFSRFG